MLLLGLSILGKMTENALDMTEAVIDDAFAGSHENTKAEIKRQNKRRGEIIDATIDFYDNIFRW